MSNKPQLIPRELREAAQPPLDLVIPVSTPRLTRAGIRAAERLAAGLHAEVRLLRIQAVPFPLPLARPPVPVEFLREQLERYESTLPIKREIRLARDLRTALITALRPGSVVVMAAKKRPWRTRNERMAAVLSHAGCSVILAYEGEDDA